MDGRRSPADTGIPITQGWNYDEIWPGYRKRRLEPTKFPDNDGGIDDGCYIA